jgi:hypothetical protein
MPMSSLAELPELVGFFSYSRDDDVDSHGALSALRTHIQGELRGLLGRTTKTFRLWQDKEAIPSGTLWESEIKTAVAQSVFFIPIITPTVVASPYCKFELESFLAREKELGRDDLVFPILYIDVPALEDSVRRQIDPVLLLIAKRQYVDWRKLRHRDIRTTEVSEAAERFCTHIRDALYRPWISPEERRRMEEAEAEARRLEAEAKRREEERRHYEAEAEQRRQAEAEAQRRVEEEAKQRAADENRRHAEEDEARRRAEAETKRRADEEEARRRAEEQARQAEAKQRAEEEERSRQEAEAKRLAEQEEAFAAAKRADDVSAVKAFLTNHPESSHTAEARTLREALLARDEACRAAMSSDDPAVLKAFISAYPKGAQADQVHGRLRSLEPLRRKVMGSIVPLFLLLASLASAGIWVLGVVKDATAICDTDTEAPQLRWIAGFTLVKDVFVIGNGRESYRRDDIKDPFQFANDCAASCRTVSSAKASAARHTPPSPNSRGCNPAKDGMDVAHT